MPIYKQEEGVPYENINERVVQFCISFYANLLNYSPPPQRIEVDQNANLLLLFLLQLRHESGLSNSSLQLGKGYHLFHLVYGCVCCVLSLDIDFYGTITGNEVIDEDVEVEGTEAPVSSYPPAELQENSGQRSNKCTSPGNSHGNTHCSYYINYIQHFSVL